MQAHDLVVQNRQINLDALFPARAPANAPPEAISSAAARAPPRSRVMRKLRKIAVEELPRMRAKEFTFRTVELVAAPFDFEAFVSQYAQGDSPANSVSSASDSNPSPAGARKESAPQCKLESTEARTSPEQCLAPALLSGIA